MLKSTGCHRRRRLGSTEIPHGVEPSPVCLKTQTFSSLHLFISSCLGSSAAQNAAILLSPGNSPRNQRRLIHGFADDRPGLDETASNFISRRLPNLEHTRICWAISETASNLVWLNKYYAFSFCFFLDEAWDSHSSVPHAHMHICMAVFFCSLVLQ